MHRIWLYGIVLGVLACKPFSNKRSEDATGTARETLERTGCLAGVVIDGQTGVRLDLAAEGRADNFFILAEGDRLQAAPMIDSDEAEAKPNLVGEYTLCDVPLEAAFPLYVSVPGYVPYMSYVLVASSETAQGGQAWEDVLPAVPTARVNLRLFPQTTAALDYQVIVSHLGSPVEGATVTFEPTGGSPVAQGPSGEFWPPWPLGYGVLSATTNAAGVATFTAASMALGASYTYHVLPADTAQQQAARGTVSVGYITTQGNPYMLMVDLAVTETDLVVVSSSLDTDDYNEAGELTYIFNRPIEIVPGSEDAITATLANTISAELATDVAGDDAPNQVNVEIVGQRLTLSPIWSTRPAKANEPALEVHYTAAVQVRPTEGHHLLSTLTVGGNVKVFGGVKAPSVATSLNLVSGGDQFAGPGGMLTDQIVVEVLDQYGAAMSGVTVTFTPDATAGTAGTPTDISDLSGQASSVWTLGSTGSQQLTVAVPAVSAVNPLVVEAAFAFSVTSGDAQRALVSSDLPDPIIVHLVDEAGPIVGGSVTFDIQTASCGALDDGLGSTGDPVTTTTDSSGDATVTWTMPALGRDCTLNVTASGITGSIPVTARSQMPTTLQAVAIAGQAADTDYGVTATVTDQSTPADVIEGVSVRFRLTTAGNLRLTTDPAPGSCSSYPCDVTVTTDSSGTASVTWRTGASATTTDLAVSLPAFVGVSAVPLSKSVP